MFKRHQVIMLPTIEKEASAIMLGTVPNWSRPTKDILDDKMDWMVFGKPQHLYIISDDEIKEGDWCLYKEKVFKIGKGDNELYHLAKKIIATTDSSLMHLSNNGRVGYKLPQIPETYINRFVEEYNKGNVITEVMVDYEVNPYWGRLNEGKEVLKINPKGNITIKKVKDSWNRDEVIELFNKWLVDYHNSNETFVFRTNLNKWIEENLDTI